MEKKKTIFDFISQVFTIFGFTMICMMVFCYFLGNSAKGYSSLFSLGTEGLTLSTLAQFLLTSTLIVFFRQFFFTDCIIKNLSITLRAIGLFASVTAMLVLFVWLFEWFPVNDWLPWVLCAICFAVSSAGAMGICVLKERLANKKMQEALERLKEGKE